MTSIILEQMSLIPRIKNAYANFENDTENINLSSCKTRQKSLENNWSKFEQNHSKLFESDSFSELKKQPYFTDNVFATTEETYLSLLSKFQLYIDTHTVNNSLQESSRNFRNHFPGQFVNDDTDRLPRINLPEFDGNFRNWESFRDIFTTTVINKVNISNVTKLRHLRSCLKGDAENLVRSYSITEDNFVLVWDKLKEKYEVKKRLVHAHVAAIFSLKPVSNPKAADLKKVLDGINTPISALKVLGRPVDKWDDLLVFHVLSLLDSETKKQWEVFFNTMYMHMPSTSTPNHDSSTANRSSSDPPTYAKLVEFLENQISILESLEENDVSLKIKQNYDSSIKFKNANVSNQPAKVFFNQSEQPVKNKNPTKGILECFLCKGKHHFAQCSIYADKSVEQRIDFVRSQSRCFNCLGKHFFDKCPSKKRCSTCNKKHHTTLHLLRDVNSRDKNPQNSTNALTVNSEKEDGSNQSLSGSEMNTIASNICGTPDQVLLSTAIVKLINDDGCEHLARALVDQGSQASFISESLFKRLQIPYKSIKLPISGVGGKTSFVCKKIVNFLLKSHFYSDFSLYIEAYVIPKITSYSPTANEFSSALSHIRGLNLADPGFCKRGQIEILLGASVHASIIEGEVKRGTLGEPIAMNSKLGWIISGNSGIGSSCCLSIISECNESNFLFDLERFWRQEEIFDTSNVLLNTDEKDCEDYFVNTHSRNSEGRYIVRLPFKVADISNLKFPGSLPIARKMLMRMETRFLNDNQFHNLYLDFMRDYENSKHMKLSATIDDVNSCYFLPHHGVLKKNCSVPKLRTVFNGSAKDYQNLSINDMLHTGANLLPDLTNLLISWMKYKYVFVSDVKQMFRQILVHEDDQKFQQILWRFNTTECVNFWSLQTVTYGMVSSPFLAIRVIKQLALDEKLAFPFGAKILNNETYMDDILSGADNLEEALEKQRDLINICKVGGFSLHKWMANDEKLLSEFSVDVRADFNSSHSYFGLLGLNWNPTDDYFSFCIIIDQFKNSITKRQVISSIAKLYDPLGWLSPVIITAKAFIQKLWLAKIDWDDTLPLDLQKEFLNWYNDITVLNGIRIDRWLGYSVSSECELYGFADASKVGYAACVYLKINDNGKICIRLIQAKSKVAPIKPLLTIPKLELSAALLLVKLTVKVLKALNLNIVKINLFTDSTDVLFWLKDHPSKWPMFIANRCSKIHTLLPEAYWSHVRTYDNPADCASRGKKPSELGSFSLWWEGGPMIKNSIELVDCEQSFQSKSVCILSSCLSNCKNSESCSVKIWELINKYSSVRVLFRITAYILRFVSKLLQKCKSNRIFSSKLFSNGWFQSVELNQRYLFASVSEVLRAKLTWIYLIQKEYFKEEIKVLSNNKKLNDSRLLSLDPFIDQNLLRLGGRIQNSLLSYDQKHPFILPNNCRIAKLLVNFYHLQTLHGGVNLTLSSIRQEFWIIKCRNLVKQCIKQCHNCLRYRAAPCNQKMGILPTSRVQRPDKPFRIAGVDYAGPYNVLRYRGRGASTYKAYIAVFICMATRAVHLELVTGYSSQDFIAAFRRFTATRGKCSELVSDQGTTFVGADKALQELYMESSVHMQELSGLLVDEGTSWSFNPPGAPHFGGIWEAAVKSVKHHLRRVVGSHTLTFEEFYTLLKQVEACLNSRPLLPLTDDPTDNQFLTPSMLLNQSNSYIIPEPDYTNSKIPPVQRYKQIQQMLQDWWKKWSLEYLQTLQERHKWKSAKRELSIDDIVLIIDEIMPPAKWPLARVVKLYRGLDNLVRVVDLKTSTSNLQRPVHKLILLEHLSNDNN